MGRSKGRSRSAKPDALIGQLGSLLWPPADANATRRQAVVLAYDPDNKYHTVLVELEEGTHELKLEEVDFQPTPAEAWGQDVVGSPVIVWWLNEPSPMWFEGTIVAYNAEDQTHKVVYVNDGEEEECAHLPHSETRRAVLLSSLWRRARGQQGVINITEMHTDLQAALADDAVKERCAYLYGGAIADAVMECSRLLPKVLGIKQQDGGDDMQVSEPLLTQHMEVDDQQRVWRQEGEEQMEDVQLGQLPADQQAEAREEQQSSLEQAPQQQRRAVLSSKRQKGVNQQQSSMQLRRSSPAGKHTLKQEGADADCAPQRSSPPPQALRRPPRQAAQQASNASPAKMPPGKDTPQPATKASMLPVRAATGPAAGQGAAAAAPGVAAVPAPTRSRELRARSGPGIMPASTSAAGLGAGSLLGKCGGTPRGKDEADGLEQQQQEQQQQEQQPQQQGEKQKPRRGRPPKQQGADHSNAGCPPAKRRRVSQSAGSDTAVPQGSTVPAASAAASVVPAESQQSCRVAARPRRAAGQQAQALAAAAVSMEEEQDGEEAQGEGEEEGKELARIPAVLQPLLQRFAVLEPTAITAQERASNMENWARHRDGKLSKALFYQLPHQRIARGHGLMFELCANKRGQAGSSNSRAMRLTPGELALLKQHRGVNTGHYLHVAEHEGKAVTTSCHQCQHQHVTYRCKAGHTSVCNICINTHYPGMSVEAMVGAECPQCLGICVCRACLRKEVEYAPPSWDEEERRFFAEYSLTCLGRHLLQWYIEECKEVAYDGLSSLLEVPQNHEAGDRACCDRCATSISNVLRSCSKCQWDICRHCCAELRAQNEWSSGASSSSNEAAPQAEAPAHHAQARSRATAAAEAGPSGTMGRGATGLSHRSRGVTQAQSAPAAGSMTAAMQGSPRQCRRAAAASVSADAVVGQAARTRSRLAQATGPSAACSPGNAAAAGAEASGAGSRSARTDEAASAPAAPDGQQGDACTRGHCPGCDEQATFVPQRFFSDDWCLKLEQAAKAYGDKHTLQALELQPPGATKEDVAMETAPMATGAAPAGKAGRRQSGRNGTAQQQQTATASQVADVDDVDGASGSGGEHPGCVYAFQRWVSESWVRKAAGGGEEMYLFTPTAEEMKTDERAKAIFRWCMAHSMPVIVRNCMSRIPWNPQCMQRALKDGRGRAGQDDEEGMLVVDCSDGHVELSGVSACDFFNAYEHTHTLAQVLGTKQSGPARASAGTSSNSAAEDKGAAAGEAAAAAAAAAPAAKGQPRPKKVRYEALLSKLLKLKDWPPGHDFAAKLQRHNQDFKEMLPCHAWTLYQGSSPLNAATQLPEGFNPPDLGPKTYIAYGMQEEVEDRDVNCGTKLHQDLSSAVNMLLHAHREATRLDGSPWEEHTVRCGRQEADEHTWNDAPALWTIGRVEDAAKVRAYLLANVESFSHHGGPVPKELLLDAVYQQAFMLTKKHREALAAQGVHLYAFEQHEQEAVFVPAGAPHQVRNMRSCIKVAVDFVPPEAFDQLVTLRQQLRHLDMHASKCGKEGEKAVDRTFTDKLQGETCMLAAAVGAWETLTGGPSGGDGVV